MDLNGELFVQQCFTDLWAADGANEPFIAFDIGANVGDWTWHLTRLIQTKFPARDFSAYLFEPVPSTYRALMRRLGSDSRLHYEELAISSKPGTALMYVDGDLAGTNSLHLGSPGMAKHQLSVTTDSIDAYCRRKGVRQVHLVKCDAEGHDMEVIRGARDLLRGESVLGLQFEYNHRWVASRNFLKDVFDLTDGLRYKVAKLCPDRLLVFTSWHPELERFFEGNYILVHEPLTARLPTQFVRWSEYNTMDFLKGARPL